MLTKFKTRRCGPSPGMLGQPAMATSSVPLFSDSSLIATDTAAVPFTPPAQSPMQALGNGWLPAAPPPSYAQTSPGVWPTVSEIDNVGSPVPSTWDESATTSSLFEPVVGLDCATAGAALQTDSTGFDCMAEEELLTMHLHHQPQPSVQHQGSASVSPMPSWTAEDLRCWNHGCDGRRFSSLGNFVRHQKEQSTGLASRRYKCPFCDQTFTRSTAKNVHLSRGRCSGQNKHGASGFYCSDHGVKDVHFDAGLSQQAAAAVAAAPTPCFFSLQLDTASALAAYQCQATGRRCQCSLYSHHPSVMQA